MDLDDVIEELQSIRSTHGNIPMVDDGNHPVLNVEFNDDDFSCVVIEFSRTVIDS